MTFAQELAEAANRTYERLRKGTREDSIRFLKSSGILTEEGNLVAKFSTIPDSNPAAEEKKKRFG